nr:hypothetical protein [Tanacetum cinerariifolium]
MPNVDIPQGIDIGGSLRRLETMRGTSAQTRFERSLEQPNEPPLIKGHTSGSREGRLEENIKLADTVPTPHDSPLTGENELSTTKDVYNKAFITLTNRVKKLESQLKQKRSRAVIHSLDEEGPKTLPNIKRSSAKEKGKGIMQETELPKKLKKKEMIQLSLDEEPFSKAKVRKNMIIYLKNQGGYKKSYFKGMKYEDIRPSFERIWDQVHTFVPKDSEIQREVMKRAGFDLQRGSSKKQRLDQQIEQTEEEAKAQGDSDQEVEELKLYMRIIPKEDIAIKSIPLAIKPPVSCHTKKGFLKYGKKKCSFSGTVTPLFDICWCKTKHLSSKTINSVKQIHAIVDGKAVVISESSVRRDLLFDDEDEPFSSLSYSMANLKFVDQHNMVAYLEKSDDYTEFHQIVNFLSLCSITYALT